MNASPGAVFFFVERRDDGRVIWRGEPSFSGGHRIPTGDPSRDDGIFGEWRWDSERLTMHVAAFCSACHVMYDT